MFIFVLIGLLILAFAAFVYMQDGSEFTKLTNYSSFDLLSNKEARKLNSMYKALSKVDGEHRILLNVHVQAGATVHKIPAVLLHESGIHLITTVERGGWIIGSDRSIDWVNVLYKNKQETFENPILVNRRSLYALRDVMPEVPEQAFHSIVLFNDGCSFQKVEITADYVEVLKQKELAGWADSLAEENLTVDEIQKVYDMLKDKMVFHKKFVTKKQAKRNKQVA